MDTIRYPLGDMTAEFVVRVGYDLAVHCEGCRAVRPKDPIELLVAGVGRKKLADLPFRCSRCGGLGKPYVTGHVENEGRATWGI